MDDGELTARLNEIVKEAKAIVDLAEESRKHASDGDLKGAVEVLALSHYKVGAFNHAKDEFLRTMRAEGVTPGS